MVRALTRAERRRWERAALRSIVAGDLRVATDYVIRWKGFRTDPVQLEMADFLQGAEPVKLLLAARGWTKSDLTQICAGRWLLNNPDEKILVGSATKEYAKKWLAGLKHLIEHAPAFESLRQRRGQRQTHKWTKSEIDVGCCTPTSQASVTVLGAESQWTGHHVGKVILDDFEIPKNSATLAAREKLRERLNELKLIINPPAADWPPPETLIIGTYQSMHSVYRALEKWVGARVYRVPAIGPDGETTFPGKFSTRYLLDHVKPDISLLMWELQMMLNPDVGDLLGGLPVRWKDLIAVEHDDPRCRLELFIDPSGCTGNDEVGYAAAGVQDHDFVYLHEWGGLRGEIGQVCGELADVVRDYQIERIWGESNMPGWEPFKQELRRALHARRLRAVIEDDPSSGNKHRRLTGTLNPMSQGHRIRCHPVCKDDPHNLEQVENLTWDSLPPESIGDDRLDVLQIACRILARRFRNPMVWQEAQPELGGAVRASGRGWSDEEAKRGGWAGDFERMERSVLQRSR